MTRLINAIRNRTAAAAGVAAAAGAAAALAATLAGAGPARATEPRTARCDLGTITITPANGLVPLTAPITFSASLSDIVRPEVTADVGVDPGAEVRLTWSVDGSMLSEGTLSPANFANHQQFFETRTTFGLGTVHQPGTIQPFVRVNGPAGATATLLHRCISVTVLHG